MICKFNSNFLSNKYLSYNMSRPRGSNSGPPLYESGALPTELGRLEFFCSTSPRLS